MPIIIEKYENRPVFKLETNNTQYILTVYYNRLCHLWYGKKLKGDVHYLSQTRGLSFSAYPDDGRPSSDAFMLECPGFGNGDYGKSMVSVVDKNGVEVCDFEYVSYKTYTGKKELKGLPSAYSENNDTHCLDIFLRDPLTGIEVTLTYSVFEECDAIVKSSRIFNPTQDTVYVKRCLSSVIPFEDDNYDAIILKGRYAMERCIKRAPIQGTCEIFSNRGASSNAMNPFMAIVGKNTCENYGDAYGTAFIYSGNFTIFAEDSWQNYMRWGVGINPEGFSWKLCPEDEFVAPEAVHVYSDAGIGGMSRAFHDFCREHITRGEWKNKKRPILINNWEGTYFDFTGEKIIEIAKKASEYGIEMMVLDDGWFGARDNDCAGLGDWVTNEEKLGMSIGELAKSINNMGMMFGLWFEPEMVNPDSDLYREHPEYALAVDGRTKLLSRNQMVLNFANPEVVDCIYNQMIKILDNANIQYIKWDFNRNLAQVSYPELGADRQGEIYHRYMLGLYSLLDRLTKRYPHILFEGCSGGGARCDFGMLCYVHQNWASDNTDAGHRLYIQHGTSLVYPTRTIGSHYTAINPVCRTTSPSTRALVAQFGSFGYELDITKMEDEELELLKIFNEDFHKYYNLVNFGDLHRLINIFEENRSAWEFVAKDKSEALVVYVQETKEITGRPPLLKLEGLDPDSVYVEEYTGQEFYGSTLMNAGTLILNVHCDFGASRQHFVRKK